MGCQKLDTDFSHILEIIHSEKRGYDEKNCVNYYPFGLQHKGYNNVVNSNSNSVASKFKFNGTELEESLGSNSYEMPLRSYDPAIARWTTIDPVVHYAMSTYNAFDNNPVTFPDPSGGDVIDTKGGVKFTGQDAIDFFKSSILSNSGNGGGDGTDWQNAFQQQGESLQNLENNIGSGDNNETGNSNDPNPIQIFMSFKFENFKKFVFEIGAQWSLKLDGNSKYDAAISARMESDFKDLDAFLSVESKTSSNFGDVSLTTKTNYDYNMGNGKGKGSVGSSLSYSATSGSPYANQYSANATAGIKYGFSGAPTWYLQSSMSGINSSLNPSVGFSLNNTLSTSNFKSYSNAFSFMHANFNYKMKLAKLKL